MSDKSTISNKYMTASLPASATDGGVHPVVETAVTRVLALPEPPIEDQRLLKADDIVLVARAEKDGNLRLLCKAWEDARIILPGQVLELRWKDGQVVATRRGERS